MATSGNPESDRFKRSITVAGHRTSLSLEPEFWQALKDLAVRRRIPVAALVAEIDGARRGRNLSSAIRVHILKSLQSR
jgi:predicted DNA-binding ribbon-helix-helix protein